MIFLLLSIAAHRPIICVTRTDFTRITPAPAGRRGTGKSATYVAGAAEEVSAAPIRNPRFSAVFGGPKMPLYPSDTPIVIDGLTAALGDACAMPDAGATSVIETQRSRLLSPESTEAAQPLRSDSRVLAIGFVGWAVSAWGNHQICALRSNSFHS